jgi:dienelactone hydrolase
MPHTERIRYVVDGVEMLGYLAVDRTARASGRPGVLLLHEGAGQDDNVRARADRLAERGYVAFALDYLGGGIEHPLATAQARLRELYESPATMRELALAGYEVLVGQPETDHERLAAVGSCFGGAMALELARSGVALRAVVGFHPGFGEPRPEQSARITASVLMMCGADDPVVSADERQQFELEMREAKVADWRLEVYGDVGHSFTNPGIAGRGLPGRFEYDERADRRSWLSMLRLLDEVFA